MLPLERAILLCHTCRHLTLHFSRVLNPWAVRYHPECALGMPQAGRALRCERYEREPGSDDALVDGMDPHPLPLVDLRASTPRWRPRGRWAVVGVAT